MLGLATGETHFLQPALRAFHARLALVIRSPASRPTVRALHPAVQDVRYSADTALAAGRRFARRPSGVCSAPSAAFVRSAPSLGSTAHASAAGILQPCAPRTGTRTPHPVHRCPANAHQPLCLCPGTLIRAPVRGGAAVPHFTAQDSPRTALAIALKPRSLR